MSIAHSSRAANLLGAVATGLVDRFREAGDWSDSARAALVQLADHPGLTVEGLRRRMGLTHSATVRMVTQLEAQGQVRRGASAHDRRAVALRLTPAGMATADGLLAQRGAVLADALSVLSPTERRLLEGLLDRVLDQLPDSADRATTICRLCDLRACPQSRCPVERSYLRHLDP